MVRQCRGGKAGQACGGSQWSGGGVDIASASGEVVNGPAARQCPTVARLLRRVRVAECLVHLKLLTLGHRARVVAVHRSHVSQQALRSGKREVLPRTALDLTYKIAAVAAARPLSPVRADRRAAAFAALMPQPRMFADRRAAAVETLCPLTRMLADRRAAAVAAPSPPPPVRALLHRPAHRCHSRTRVFLSRPGKRRRK